LYSGGQIPRQKVNAYKLARAVADVGPEKSRPREKKHCHIDIPGHGKVEKPQNG
jgi:hypothetical protein